MRQPRRRRQPLSDSERYNSSVAKSLHLAWILCMKYEKNPIASCLMWISLSIFRWLDCWSTVLRMYTSKIIYCDCFSLFQLAFYIWKVKLAKMCIRCTFIKMRSTENFMNISGNCTMICALSFLGQANLRALRDKYGKQPSNGHSKTHKNHI